MRIRPLVWVLSLILGAVVLTAPPATATDTGRITGTVTGPAGPAEGVQVLAYQWGEQYAAWVPVAWAEADAHGRFAVTGLDAGAYRLRFDDYSDRGLLSGYWGGGSTVETATSTSVAAGQTVTGRNIALAPGGRISGTVTGPEGEPAGGVRVMAYLWNLDYYFWEPVRGTLTASDGSYDLGGLPTDAYLLEFSGGRYLTEYWNDALDRDSARQIPVTAGTTRDHTDVQLGEGGHITGIVTVPGSKPIVGELVHAYTWDSERHYWAYVNSGVTDPDGRYDVPGLSTGSYRLEFENEAGNYLTEFWDDAASIESATDIAVVAGLTTTGKNAQLAPRLLGAGPGRIAGTVVDVTTHLPVAGAAVAVYAQDDDGWSQVMQTTTDAQGGYFLTGLSTGDYRVGFSGTGYLPEFWDDAHSVRSAADVAVTRGATTADIDASLTPATTGPSSITVLTAPRVTGKVRAGATLRIRTGRWDPPRATVAVRWYAGADPIPHQTGQRLHLAGKVAQRVIGKRIGVRVVVKAPGFTTYRTTVWASGRLKPVR